MDAATFVYDLGTIATTLSDEIEFNCSRGIEIAAQRMSGMENLQVDNDGLNI